MEIKQTTNTGVFGMDWASSERAAFLRSIPAQIKSAKELELAPGLPARGVLGVDVSAMDRRSVKAQLSGRGDLRSGWWNLNERIHHALRPMATTEEIMYAFHKRHHAVTIAFLTLLHDYLGVFQAFKTDGVAAGIKSAIELANDRGHKVG